MTELHIALQCGFRQSEVTIWVDQVKVYEKTGVSTDHVLSHADAVSVKTSEEICRIDVLVNPGEHKYSITFDPTQHRFIGINRDAEGAFYHLALNEPFMYS